MRLSTNADLAVQVVEGVGVGHHQVVEGEGVGHHQEGVGEGARPLHQLHQLQLWACSSAAGDKTDT